MLTASYNFWENTGRGSFENYSAASYLEVTSHAHKRMKERNIRLDSVLALSEYASRYEEIRKGRDKFFCVRHLGDTPEDSLVIPFEIIRTPGKDVILKAITTWRFLNQDDDFFYGKGQKVYDVQINRIGQINISLVKEDDVLRKNK